MVRNEHRTEHYRVLAGHMRLWAETERSSDVMEELRLMATQLDQLAARVEAKNAQHRDSLEQTAGF